MATRKSRFHSFIMLLIDFVIELFMSFFKIFGHLENLESFHAVFFKLFWDPFHETSTDFLACLGQ